MTFLRFIIIFHILISCALHASEPIASPLVVSVVEWPTMFPVRSKTTGETMVPGIEIYSDGTTIIKRRDGHETAKHIDRNRLRWLLTYLSDQRLFDLTADKIAEDINRAGPLPHPTDNPITILFASTGDRKVTIAQDAFPFFEKSFPKVESVQTVSRCISKIYEAAGETH